MALDRQNISVNFSQGVDTKTDPKQVVQGKLLNLENGAFTSTGRIKKRKGFENLGSTIRTANGDIQLTNAATTTSYLDELTLCDNAYLYSYNDSSDTWLNKGSIASTHINEFPVVRNSYNQTCQDSCYVNNIIVTAWEDSAGGVRYSVIDKSTEQNIVHDTVISATGIKPKLSSVGNYVFIFYVNTSNNKVYLYTVNILNPIVASTSVDIISDINTNFNYDTCKIGSKVFIGYSNSSNGVSIRYITANLTISAASSQGSENASSCITVFEDGASENVVCAYHNGTAVKYFVYSYDLSTLVQAATLVSTIGSIFNITGHKTIDAIAGDFDLFYTVSAASKLNYYVKLATVTGYSLITTAVFLKSVCLASKAFLYNSLNYVTVIFDTEYQPTYFIVDENGSIVSKILYSLGGGFPSKNLLTEVSIIDSTNYLMALLHKDFAYASNSNIYYQTGVDACTINFNDSQNSYLHGELADNLHLSGGVLTLYDGVTPVEHGFHVFPEGITASNSTSSQTITFNNINLTPTFTNGSPNVTLSSTASLAVGSACYMSTSGTLPTNFAIGTIYYIVSKIGTVVTFSASLGGGAITAGSAGSGVHTVDQISIDPYATFTGSSANITLDSSYGFKVGSICILTTTGTAPTNFTKDTVTYYVISLVGNVIQLSTTQGGGAITAGSAGSGIQVIRLKSDVIYDSSTFNSNFCGAVNVNYTSLSNFSVGSTFQLTTTGYLPNNYSKDTTYYITSLNTVAKYLTISTTASGNPILPKSAASGTTTLNVKSIAPYCTFTQNSANIVLNDSSNFYVNGKVTFQEKSGTLPGNFNTTTTYYILSVVTATKTITVGLKKSGDLIVASTAGTGTYTCTPTTMAAGVYQYILCYEWTDNKGQIHRSATSVPSNDVVKGFFTIITLVGTANAVTLTIPTLRLTSKKDARSPVRLVIYRTTVNGSVFYQVTSPTSPTLNDATVDTVTYTDVLTDDMLIANSPLYTTGGVIENISPPPCSSMTTYKNRLILLSTENPLELWYSKQVIKGSPVEFSDSFVLTLDSKGGDITAVSNLDDKLVIFKNSSIFIVTGTGPTDTGSQNDFSDAQMITTDNGCTNPRSVVITPLGIMYQSAKGLYLLDRSLQVKYIGAPVEAYNSNNVVATLLNSKTTQIWFFLDNAKALIYDYYVDQWSIYTNINSIDATLYQDKVVYIQADGKVLQESSNYTDSGRPIKLKLVTSWLSFAGLQSFQRVRRMLILGEYISPHYLKVGIATNFNPNIIQQAIVDTSSLVSTDLTFGSDTNFGSQTLFGINNSLGEYPRYQWQVHIADQKSETIQVTIEDTQTESYGEGYNLSALGFEVAVKKGTFKMHPARSY